MRKYLGIISILILIGTYCIFYIPGIDKLPLPHWFLYVFFLTGYIAAAFASWYSHSGFWRRASATILIILPIGFIILVVGISISGL
ncbi:hypothetical protein I6J18_04515 [Peribacillus psychrosaccharolyticus]|uniref:Uncharacterized protein n=1 Tax=Peribacillus psychrosaccharolyticus TaxID=1407 RepID=A0A974S2B7_PERPY|nr:hypothetical protein [Peribacillus psychrosaccharolyticus]MEC2057417.1 hypothetical protein [Peribacillus psychrosaccharolyticus]MED3742757.1 hypothetical protein [Peribacillus psychrosaccharolyticus]QQT01165.1 hypothetical protein I6J18_04515 [Peribacillus psychrosaccharolyticus]